MSERIHEVGDYIIVEFVKNTKGGKAVCRVNNKIGFINSDETKFVAPRSVWGVAISKVDKMHVIVDLVDKIKAPWENLKEIDERIKSSFGKKKTERKRKGKRKYTNV